VLEGGDSHSPHLHPGIKGEGLTGRLDASTAALDALLERGQSLCIEHSGDDVSWRRPDAEVVGLRQNWGPAPH
jgi:hypothetical protein